MKRVIESTGAGLMFTTESVQGMEPRRRGVSLTDANLEPRIEVCALGMGERRRSIIISKKVASID